MTFSNVFKARFGRAAVALGVASVTAVAVAACGSDSGSSDSGGGEVAVVAYSTPQDLYEKTLEPDFNQTSEGGGVTFKNSFGASGDQSRAVEAGQPADFVHLALEPDMQRLVDAGIVDSGWADNDYNGILQTSVVTFVVRGGNPDNIQSWDDLITGNVDVVVPNPFTSGGARWDIMAAYGAQIEQGASEDEALDYISQLLENTPAQPASAADALAAFTGGQGDVLISYENEAIRAQNGGEDVDYVIPDETIKIETPAAVTVDSGADAQAFLDYLYTDAGQQAFADAGYRPVVDSVLKQNADAFPTPKDLFTIDDLGGWDTVTTDFFDPETGKVAEIEKNLGVSTG